MDRRKFLGRLGFVAVGAVVATKVVVEVSKEQPIEPKIYAGIDPFPVGDGWMAQIESRGSQPFTLYTDKRGEEQFRKAIEKLNESYGRS